MTKSETSAFDRLDYRILQILAQNGRCSDVSVGEQVGLSSNAAARRRKLLEDDGVVMGYAAQLDLERLNCGLLILVQIELRSQSDDALERFEAAIKDCRSVSRCWFVSGDVDFIALVHVSSLKDYDAVYRDQLSSLPNVSRIRSSFVLRSVIDRPIAPSVLGP